jgi:DNA-binding PadR family transcriptional regulator
LNPEPTTLLQGTLDLLILKSLVAGEKHGLGISRRIQQITGGTLIVKPGSLFPAPTEWRKKAGSQLFGEIRRTIAARSTTA